MRYEQEAKKIKRFIYRHKIFYTSMYYVLLLYLDKWIYM